MWTTVDGYRLTAPPGARMPDELLRALATRASYSGPVRWRDGTRPAFTSARGARAFQLVVRPTGPRQGQIVAVRARPAAEALDSHGHRLAQSNVVNALLRAGLQLQQGSGPNAKPGVVRDNRQQIVSGTGAADPGSMPDVSYVAEGGQRVNVEVDTNPDESIHHLQRLVAADPHAVHVGLVVDRATGQVVGRQVYDPRRDYSAARIAAIRAALRRGDRSVVPGHSERPAIGARLPPPARVPNRPRVRAPRGPAVTFGTATTPTRRPVRKTIVRKRVRLREAEAV